MPLSTETYILPINSIDLFPTNKLKPFIVRRYKEKRVVSSSLQSTRYLHIEEIYPSDQWLRVYTDVSKDNRDNTGAVSYTHLDIKHKYFCNSFAKYLLIEERNSWGKKYHKEKTNLLCHSNIILVTMYLYETILILPRYGD